MQYVIPYLQGPAQCIEETASLAEALDLMRTNKTGAVVVLRDGKPAGIFTERDLLNKLDYSGPVDFSTLQLSGFYTRSLVTTTPNAELMVILSTMLEKGIRHLPVIEGDEVHGILTLRDILQHHYQSLEQIVDGAIRSLSSTVEIRDPYTAGHQRRAAYLAALIAEKLGFSKDRVRGVRFGAMVHDLGKISVPVEILSKPGRLSSTEFALIQRHSSAGYEILHAVPFPWPIATWIQQHHERMDGTGYPLGLSGDDIAIEAMIISASDMVEAIASHRPYRPALGLDRALEELKQMRDKRMPAPVVDACLEIAAGGYLKDWNGGNQQ